MSHKVESLYVYPIKSLGEIAVPLAEVRERGFKYDRRWMLIDKEGHFLTQRVFPIMSSVRVGLQQDTFMLSHRTNQYEPIFIPLIEEKGDIVSVEVWGDVFEAVWPHLSADQWLSDILKEECRLVYLPGRSKRLADSRYAPFEVNVSFADSFPYLLTNTASLEDLNQRAGENFEMLRFRPNIVVSGIKAFEEDQWKKIKIGDIIFHLVKPCARCVLITVDPKTGKKGKEPLKTLSTFRSVDNKVLFGQNMVAEGEGIIHVGDKVEIIE